LEQRFGLEAWELLTIVLLTPEAPVVELRPDSAAAALAPEGLEVSMV
jgi:hypothetical protein